jgi:hypothetical protein
MPRWIVAEAGVIVVVATALWWWVPKWQANLLSLKIRDPKARADIEDNFRKTIGQLLGGAAVLIGAGFAYYQSQVTQQATHDQLKATYDQLISQQVAKGFEQLGNKDNIILRLGGIYALEGVMNTSEQYHRPVLETLCAFVRDNAKTKIDKDKPKGPEVPATDIQAALTVIGRRTQGPGLVDLSGADLHGANLEDNYHTTEMFVWHTIDLTFARLHGADLRGVDLRGADLRGADLSGADLRGANLRDTNLLESSLSGANLSGADLKRFNDNLWGGDEPFGTRWVIRSLIGESENTFGLGYPDPSTSHLGGEDLVTQKQLDKACGDNTTKLPHGLTIKPCQQ